jgi:hypothetical protein
LLGGHALGFFVCIVHLPPKSRHVYIGASWFTWKIWKRLCGIAGQGSIGSKQNTQEYRVQFHSQHVQHLCFL